VYIRTPRVLVPTFRSSKNPGRYPLKKSEARAIGPGFVHERLPPPVSKRVAADARANIRRPA
jgi:hypothetical protein